MFFISSVLTTKPCVEEKPHETRFPPKHTHETQK